MKGDTLIVPSGCSVIVWFVNSVQALPLGATRSPPHHPLMTLRCPTVGRELLRQPGAVLGEDVGCHHPIPSTPQASAVTPLATSTSAQARPPR